MGVAELCRSNWLEKNPDYFKAQRKKTAEARREYNRRWRAEHAEEFRIKNAARQRAKRKDPQFRIAHNLRTRLCAFVKGKEKAASTLTLLGMDLHEFRIYIRGQFRPGMTWENYGPVWELDHVRPCASFDLKDLEQQKICFRWDNYQPLFWEENRRKEATYVG